MCIIGSIILVILIVPATYILALFGKYLMLFNSVPCTECDSCMEFKGEKKKDEEDVYVFQCPKCNEVREIPTKKFNARFCNYKDNINL